VVSELQEDAKKYGDERRTLIKTEARAQLEVSVLEEPVTVIVSQKGWIRARSGHGVDLSTLTFKDGDALLQDPRVQDHRLRDRARRLRQDLHCRCRRHPLGPRDGAPVNTLVNSSSDDIVWWALARPGSRSS